MMDTTVVAATTAVPGPLSVAQKNITVPAPSLAIGRTLLYTKEPVSSCYYNAMYLTYGHLKLSYSSHTP